MLEKLEKNEKKLKKQLKIYMKKVQDFEGELGGGTALCFGSLEAAASLSFPPFSVDAVINHRTPNL